jgi:hypothetical protein
MADKLFVESVTLEVTSGLEAGTPAKEPLEAKDCEGDSETSGLSDVVGEG